MENAQNTVLTARLARSRQIITSACMMLQQARENAPRFAQESYAASADCYVLLVDATRIFCDCLCEQFGESANKRWSAALPELLLAHPSRCRETLALLERRDFKELSYFHFDAA